MNVELSPRTPAQAGGTFMVPLRIDPAEFGAALARMPSDAQGRALRAFCEELLQHCGSVYNSQIQLAYVAQELSDDHRELLAMLAPK